MHPMGNMDFSDVDSLKSTVNVSDSSLLGLDLALGEILNCPELATMSLLVLGGLAMLKGKRKSCLRPCLRL